MASSSSSSSIRSWKYDVFFSFRGTDTRKGIANEICNRLSSRGIKTFMDEHGLQVGDVISPALINAIKESRFAIVIFSQNYASSAWCLEELREICLSMEDNRILPLFYHVDPTDVRYQKRSFGEAFSMHDTFGRHESEKVEQWRAALKKVASISGWNTNDFKTHSELVEKIVEFLSSKVPPDAIEFSSKVPPDDFHKNVEVPPDWDYFCITINDGSSTRPEYEYEQGDRNSRSLFLKGPTISTLPDWFIKAVTEKTEKLEYYHCEGLSDIVMEYDHGRLHKLKHLTVAYSDVYLKELMNTTRRVETGPVFENLEELRLKFLMPLEELCVGELPPGSLSNLKVFHVRFCKILRSVSEFVQRLPNLEKLDLNCVFELEYVFRCEGVEPEQPKLREMHLLFLYALESICNGPAPHAMFQSLKILTVYDCELLQSLFASDVAQCLVQLEDLLVEGCPLLERVMEAVNKEKTVLPKLKNLVLKNLPILYGAIAAVDIECPSLEHLMVEDCPKLLFSTSSDLFEAFKSRNQFSFSASTSDPVQLDDPQLYQTLYDRTSCSLWSRW